MRAQVTSCKFVVVFLLRLPAVLWGIGFNSDVDQNPRCCKPVVAVVVVVVVIVVSHACLSSCEVWGSSLVLSKIHQSSRCKLVVVLDRLPHCWGLRFGSSFEQKPMTATV